MPQSTINGVTARNARTCPKSNICKCGVLQWGILGLKAGIDIWYFVYPSRTSFCRVWRWCINPVTRLIMPKSIRIAVEMPKRRVDVLRTRHRSQDGVRWTTTCTDKNSDSELVTYNRWKSVGRMSSSALDPRWYRLSRPYETIGLGKSWSLSLTGTVSL
jgi:hypothetical protein